ncbi:hypothetical protein AKJ16_DCAP19055 [Drosera capensis]
MSRDSKLFYNFRNKQGFADKIELIDEAQASTFIENDILPLFLRYKKFSARRWGWNWCYFRKMFIRRNKAENDRELMSYQTLRTRMKNLLPNHGMPSLEDMPRILRS